MVAVEDVLTESLTACVSAWFDPGFSSHPFFHLQTICVPDSVKPIPRRWIEDVEVGFEDGLGAEDGDVMGIGPVVNWSHDQGRKRLEEALARLDCAEDLLAHPKVNRKNKLELSAEKRRVKQELKRYDAEFRKQFLRLPTHTEKEPMRPLYIYYRRLKAMITQAEQQDKTSAGRRGSGANLGSDDEGGGQGFGPPRESLEDLPSRRTGTNITVDQIAAIEARIDSLQSEKGAVRAKLQSFQEKFVSENNRKIRFHKDILPIEREYRMYKTLKDDISKAESQLRDLKANAGIDAYVPK